MSRQSHQGISGRTPMTSCFMVTPSRPMTSCFMVTGNDCQDDNDVTFYSHRH